MDDEVGAIMHCLGDDGLADRSMPPHRSPATDRQLAGALGAALHRPTALAVPAGALRLLLGTEMADELLLGGQRVLPAVLSARGFVFAHTGIDEALGAVLSADG